jgi:hypothetical protein
VPADIGTEAARHYDVGEVVEGLELFAIPDRWHTHVAPMLDTPVVMQRVAALPDKPEWQLARTVCVFMDRCINNEAQAAVVGQLNHHRSS